MILSYMISIAQKRNEYHIIIQPPRIAGAVIMAVSRSEINLCIVIAALKKLLHLFL